MVVFPGAKINLGLYVTGRRSDMYHDIETIFHPIGLSDILEAVEDPGSGPGSIRLVISGLPVEGGMNSNLVYRAYQLVHESTALPGIKVFLHKCIPTGAGLGGGSSDGASMLMLLNRMFSLDLSFCDLSNLALRLGSDCPFFLDPVPSLARGRGEDLKPSGVSLRGMSMLLFHPGTGISTASAYRNVTVGEPLNSLERIAESPVSSWKDKIENVFEPYAFSQQPVIRFIRDELYRSGAVFAGMTGSGSAVFGLFDSETEVPDNISGYLIWRESF